MAHAGWTVESMASRLPQPLGERAIAADSQMRKLFEAWIDGWLSLWEADLDDLDVQMGKKTATGAFLRLWNRFFGAKAPDGVSDARLRFHLALELLRRQGGPGPDDIRQIVAFALDTDINNITLVENEDETTAEYVPAQFYITFDQSLLEDAGFATSEYVDAVADIDRTLDHIAGTGIRGFVVTLGGSTFDSGLYDDAIYGT